MWPDLLRDEHDQKLATLIADSTSIAEAQKAVLNQFGRLGNDGWHVLPVVFQMREFLDHLRHRWALLAPRPSATKPSAKTSKDDRVPEWYTGDSVKKALRHSFAWGAPAGRSSAQLAQQVAARI